MQQQIIVTEYTIKTPTSDSKMVVLFVILSKSSSWHLYNHLKIITQANIFLFLTDLVGIINQRERIQFSNDYHYTPLFKCTIEVDDLLMV